ncbi:MAG: hypothetical protein PF501_01470 [Salinisphaera sp.]|jgi:hypothetical protein|nr:hypothetical protein [Salinisphaera sp.]
MTDWFWSHGHLAWPLFVALVYSGVLVLLADYCWRLVTLPARQILAGVLAVWLLGLIATYVIWL